MPLPRKQADRLIAHLHECSTCRAAKTEKTYNYCDTGKLLIQLTLKERHGDQ